MRDGWELTRRLDVEQLLTATAGVRLALPDRQYQFRVVHYEGELNAEDADARLA